MSQQEITLFLHIPKTAGTTLKAIIYDQVACADYYVSENNHLHAGVYYFPVGFFKPQDLVPPPDVLRALRRPDLRAVVGHCWFGIHEHIRSRCRYMTVLREPVDRVVSLYFHLRSDLKVSLEEFVRDPPYREVDNDQTRRIAGIEPAVGACSRSVLEKAKENLATRFEAVGTMERFDETLRVFKRKFLWLNRIHDYRTNTNPHRQTLSELPERTIQAVRARNELDCELYEFADDLLTKATRALS